MSLLPLHKEEQRLTVVKNFFEVPLLRGIARFLTLSVSLHFYYLSLESLLEAEPENEIHVQEIYYILLLREIFPGVMEAKQTRGRN